MRQKSNEARLIIARSEKDANLFYATKFLAPDPFIFIEAGRRKIAVLSDLELDRAKAESAADEVLAFSHIRKMLERKGIRAGISDVAAHVLNEHKARNLLVPFNFPIAHADSLRRKGFVIRWKREPFFEARTVKTGEEIRAITQTLRHTESAIREAVRVLERAKIKGRYLTVGGKKLRAEDLRKIIHAKLIESDCVAAHTIVACGPHTVDPHNLGSGPLLAHEPIILDVFPRSNRTQYFADITRTFVRGKASRELKKMYAAVKRAQSIAFDSIREGADGGAIHGKIQRHFEALGFRTGEMGGRMQGFFHGTGHGVGLEIHEPPRISGGGEKLKTNQVTTVEPGLYYKGIGGIRLEDMVVVRERGCLNLTRLPKFLEI